MRFDEEPPTAILGAAVRALEVLGKEVNEETLLEAVKSRGIDRHQVKGFLAKAERGKRRGRYPEYFQRGILLASANRNSLPKSVKLWRF